MNQTDPTAQIRELAQAVCVAAMRRMDATDPAVDEYEAAKWNASYAIVELAEELDLLHTLGELVDTRRAEQLSAFGMASGSRIGQGNSGGSR